MDSPNEVCPPVLTKTEQSIYIYSYEMNQRSMKVSFTDHLTLDESMATFVILKYQPPYFLLILGEVDDKKF